MLKAIIAAALLAATALPAAAATIWDGPETTFTRTVGQDGAVDVIVAGVVELTRSDAGGALYNTVSETSFDMGERTSPADTEWAFSGLNGNGTVVLADAVTGGYTYAPLQEAAGNQIGFNIVGPVGILHILSLDIYIGIQFTDWTAFGSGGGFSYTRTTEGAEIGDVPVPAAGLLLLGGLGALAAARRRA